MTESTEYDALFRAIEKDINDDTPHLVSADWCDENDEADMAYATPSRPR